MYTSIISEGSGRGARGMKKRPDDSGQLERFIDAARKLEADEAEERFDAALKKVAAHKQPDRPKEAKDKK
jgi:hypothetical protein